MGLRLEYKATGAAPAAVEAGVIEADESTGVVEALVSITGVVDEDGDEIAPGAYRQTLAKRTPKGIFHHDWHKWVAKTLAIEEILPGDPRLPVTTRSGAPWPAGAGALWVKCQFNLGTSQGRDAFSNVQFFADEAEWSIGYKVAPGNAVKGRDGVRRIRQVDLYEYSPVLFGAAPLSGTLSIKQLTDPADPDDDEDDDEEGLHAAAEAVMDDDETPPASALTALDLDPDDGDGDGDGDGEEDPGGPSIFDGMDTGQDAPAGPSLLDDDAPQSTARPAPPPARRPARRGATSLLGDEQGPPPEPPRGASLFDAIDLGRDEESTARPRRSRKALEEEWEVKGGVPGVADTPADAAAVRRLKHAYTTGKLAVQIRWGQPGDFMRCVRIASKHLPPDKAKGFCANRHKEALGVWPGREGGTGKKDAYDPQLEVGPHAGHLLDLDELETKTLQLPGTLEALQGKIRSAVEELLAPWRTRTTATAGPAEPAPHSWVCVEGTWADRVVVTHEHGDTTQCYSIPYTLSVGGEVMLGTPQPVTLTVTPALPGTGAGAGSGGLASKDLPALARSVRGALTGLETKAGRVFSAANEKRIRQAVELLLEAFRSAGIDLRGADRPEQADEPLYTATDPTLDTDTTAPSIRGKAVLSGDLLHRSQSLKSFIRQRRECEGG